ncbi:MAG: hypothetical protein M3Q30_19430 [Actinomycetota bacterium]|nr:hypothetical protein [Actinomycetota bacterium]
MDWKQVVGWILVALGVVRLFQTVSGATNSYGLGQLTGAILFILGGIWLIRSGKPRVRT